MNVNGEEEVVGMGGWILEIEGDPDAASKTAGTVNLCGSQLLKSKTPG